MLKNENIIFQIASFTDFSERALETFNFQYRSNPIYRKWTDLLGIVPARVKEIEAIPFLPIEFFKNAEVVSSARTDDTIIFTSSSTTSQVPAKHFVTDISLYETSFLNCFKRFYGEPSEFCVLALLPNYLQRKNSSLVYMCNRLIRESGHPSSGFFLDNIEELIEKINELKHSGQKTLLIGVSYALLDLCEKRVFLEDNFIVMETGGMKGTRREMLKGELHEALKKGFNVKKIHSEYGMTELLSQAYSRGGGWFESPPWMKFLIREIDDPLKLMNDGRTGGINVIDLANVNSCSFIATKDLGRLVNVNGNEKLELMGRYDNSDVRGCNLMMESF